MEPRLRRLQREKPAGAEIRTTLSHSTDVRHQHFPPTPRRNGQAWERRSLRKGAQGRPQVADTQRRGGASLRFQFRPERTGGGGERPAAGAGRAPRPAGSPRRPSVWVKRACAPHARALDRLVSWKPDCAAGIFLHPDGETRQQDSPRFIVRSGFGEGRSSQARRP